MNIIVVIPEDAGVGVILAVRSISTGGDVHIVNGDPGQAVSVELTDDHFLAATAAGPVTPKDGVVPDAPAVVADNNDPDLPNLHDGTSEVIGGTQPEPEPAPAGDVSAAQDLGGAGGDEVDSVMTITVEPLLQVATVGQPFSAQFSVTGGTGPFSFYEKEVEIPGLDLSNSGLLEGTPTEAGTFAFVVEVEDEPGSIVTFDYPLTVFAAASTTGEAITGDGTGTAAEPITGGTSTTENTGGAGTQTGGADGGTGTQETGQSDGGQGGTLKAPTEDDVTDAIKLLKDNPDNLTAGGKVDLAKLNAELATAGFNKVDAAARDRLQDALSA